MAHRPPTEAVRIELGQLPQRRRIADKAGRALVAACAGITVVALVAIVGLLVVRGLPTINWQFLTSYGSARVGRAGVKAAVVGTLWLGFLSMAFGIPIGIAAAIYLNEFAKANRLTALLRASISNLAGVPSVVFGILGLALFVRALVLGKSVLAAGLTLAVLTLPIIIVVAEEALKTVPRSLREAAFALGATRWQVVRHHVLPYAMPGMLTGSILALSRSMGETAPLILIGAAIHITFLPVDPLDSFTALPIQAYTWAQDSRASFNELAWGAVLLLLLITLVGNIAAIVLRDRFQRKYRW